MSNSTGSLVANTDVRFSISTLGVLTVDTIAAISRMSLVAVAYTQGVNFATQEFTVEVCGSEQVMLTMPSTNSSLDFVFLKFEGYANWKYLDKDTYSPLFMSTSDWCPIVSYEIVK